MIYLFVITNQCLWYPLKRPLPPAHTQLCLQSMLLTMTLWVQQWHILDRKCSRLPLWSHGTSLFHNPQPTGFNHGGEESIALEPCLQQQQQPTSTTKFACLRYHYACEMCRWSVVPAQHNEYARLPMGLHCIIKSYPASMCRCFKPLTSQSCFILTGSTASVYCCIVNN